MDRIVFSCPKCELRRKTYAKDRERIIQCPKCEYIFQVKHGKNIVYKEANKPPKKKSQKTVVEIKPISYSEGKRVKSRFVAEDPSVIKSDEMNPIDKDIQNDPEYQETETYCQYQDEMLPNIYDDEDDFEDIFSIPDRKTRKKLFTLSHVKLMMGIIIISGVTFQLAKYLRPNLFGNKKITTRKQGRKRFKSLLDQNPDYVKKAKKATMEEVEKAKKRGVHYTKKRIKKIYQEKLKQYKEKKSSKRELEETLGSEW